MDRQGGGVLDICSRGFDRETWLRAERLCEKHAVKFLVVLERRVNRGAGPMAPRCQGHSSDHHDDSPAVGTQSHT